MLVVAFHGVVVVGEGLLVAIEDIGVPGCDNAGGTPFRRVEQAAAELNEFGGDIGDESVGMLGVGDVVFDFSVKPVHVPIHHDGVRHEVVLFEPAKFFAVRAVGEDGLGVGENGAIDESMNAIEGFVGAGKRSGGEEIGMDELAGEGVNHRHLRI